ncbi:MAG TPA: RIO1 family regulatory kinase/ATPase, partial [Pseudonocardia sp.]|nr:RIO1 family regulatory kinase/ATPase [Pseudonocardia sp.]
PARARPRRPSGQEPAPPARLPRAVWVWAALLVGSTVALVLLTVVTRRPTVVQAVDRAVQRLLGVTGDADTLARDLELLGSTLGYRVLWIPTVVVLAWFARWRHLTVYLATISVIAAVAQVASGNAALARAVRVGVTGSPDLVVVPAWPVVVLSAVVTASLFALAPAGPRRRWGWGVATALVLALALARIALGLDSASATIVSAVLGCSASALAFLLFAPEDTFPVVYHRETRAHLRLDAERTGRVVRAVRDQLGVRLTEIDPYRLDGSAGSTPCRLRLAAGPPEYLFGKLYATNHLRSDRWYKFARVLRYGRLEDEAPFSSVRRLVEHEDYMLRLLRDGGVRVPEPVGVVEVIPGREYLLVTELVPDSVEILDVDRFDDGIVDDALSQVARLWAAGAAHRDIKPSNVVVQGRRVYLVDVSFGEVRPSRWREDVDLANMMLTLALAVGPERVLARARLLFDLDEIAEAFAATGSVTLPRQLRRRIEASGRDLVADFRALLPPHPPIAVQRWSVRRVVLAVATAVGLVAAVALTGLNLVAGRLL